MINKIRHRVEKYCSEPLEHIENYEEAVNDSEHKWDCHHRLEIQGPFRNSKELLIRCGMYWNVPASQLIFLRHDEHIRLHKIGNKNTLGKKTFLGHRHSEETKRKMSEARNGQHRSEETKKRISEAIKNHWEKRRAGK